MRGRSIFALCAFAFVGVAVISASDSRGAIVLISRTNKAQSSASNSSGSASDHPADQVLGTTLGAFHLSSSCQTPDAFTSASASLTSDVGDNGNDDTGGHLMDISMSASMNVHIAGDMGGGVSEVIVRYQFTTPVKLLEQLDLFGVTNSFQLTIKNSANQTVSSQFPPSNQTLNLLADTYTFDFIDNRPPNVGTSASASGVFEFNVVPEPGMAGVAGMGLLGLLSRRKRI